MIQIVGNTLVEQVDYVCSKINKFDPNFTSIEGWFRRYEYLTKKYAWTTEEQLDALSSFFDSSLCKILFFKELDQKNRPFNYMTSKKRLIDEIYHLTASDGKSLSSQLTVMIDVFERYRFSRNEIKYWIVEHFEDPDKLRIYFTTLINQYSGSKEVDLCINFLKNYFCIFIDGFDYNELADVKDIEILSYFKSLLK